MSRPIRFTFILIVVASCAALAAVGGWRFARASAPVPGPIVLLSIDSLRADHLPAYGYRGASTPALDALARDGVVFERAYAHAVQTLPAHVAMLSGRLPFETGVRDDEDVLKPGERLVSQMLRDRAYGTAAIVSSGRLRRATGIAAGFEVFEAKLPPGPPDAAPEDRERDGEQSERIAERWLGSAGSQRLFLFLHLNEPHAPHTSSEAGATPYDGEIEHADAIVGRFVRYLKSHQLYDQSTIIVTSDHGESLGDHGEQEHGLFAYEAELHVPLIVKQAGNAGAGRRVLTLVQHIDLAPTILDLAKAPGAGGLRGRSLKPLLDGSGTIAEQPVYSEALYGYRRFGWPPFLTLTDGRTRYVKAGDEELLRTEPVTDEGPGTDQGPRTDQGPSPKDQGLLRPWRSSLSRLVGTTTPDATADEPDDAAALVEKYRWGLRLAADRQWPSAITLFQQVLASQPQAAAVWMDLAGTAMRAGRFEAALDAYQRTSELLPSDPAAHVGAATALVKLRRYDDARERAGEAAMLAAHDPRRAAEARAIEAMLDGHALAENGNYEEALPAYEQAFAALAKVDEASVPDVHYFAADALAHLDRGAEAEWQLLEELAAYPHSVRAAAALAALYQSQDRKDEAAQVLADLVATTPTPEAAAVAARLHRQLPSARPTH